MSTLAQPALPIGSSGFVSSITATFDGTGGTSIPTAGNDFVVGVMVPNLFATNPITTSMSDDQGNTYSLIRQDGGAGKPYTAIYKAPIGVSAATTITLTLTSGTDLAFGMTCCEVTDIGAADQQATAGGIGNSTPTTSVGTLTTGDAAEFCVCMLALGAASSAPTAGSGWTRSDTSGTGGRFIFEYQIKVAAGAINTDINGNVSSDDWQQSAVTFHNTAAPPPSTSRVVSFIMEE